MTSKFKLNNWRLNFLTVLTLVVVVLIVVKLFVVQVVNHNFYVTLAQDQHELFAEIDPGRGQIYVTDKESEEPHVVAGNIDLGLLYIVPREIEDPVEVAKKLSEILDLEFEEILDKANKKDDVYEPIKRKLSKKDLNKIKDLDLVGVGITKEPWRFYPEENFASHILGFVGFSGDTKSGRYGVEGYYDDILTGESGFVSEERDGAGAWIAVGNREIKEARPGADLILTIDRLIQFKAEQELSDAVEKWGADSGTIIVLEPSTGFILALANQPDFNPNKYSETKEVDTFNNSAIFDTYEPGSVFKPIIMSIALEQGVVDPFTTYTDTGSVKVDKYTISNFDHRSYGLQDMTDVLEKSINTGMVFVAQKMGRELTYNGLTKFGFGKMTGIALDTEAQTFLKDGQKWRNSNLATISFGQGIAVTPIQIAAGIGAIANDGKLMAPQIIKEFIRYDDNGAPTRDAVEPKVVGEPISSSTASTMSAMLVSAVDNGFGKPAKVAGYSIAGKTGTAEIPDKLKGGYYEDKRITSFVGFAPYEDPRFVILVKLDLPQSYDERIQFLGSNTAAPVFKNLAKFILDYYKIPPAQIEQ